MAALTDALITRIKGRVRDPARQNDTPPTIYGRTVTVGTLSIAGLNLGALLSGNFTPQPVSGPVLPPPASAERIASAEAKLGFPLPADLRRLYADVADGGFGPGAGLLPLDEMTNTFLALVATPPGRRGQKWPVTLLPITWTDPGHHCCDTANGAVIFWDEEELADGASDKVWKRSFKPEAPDLAAWLERWLGTASPEEQIQSLMQDAMLNNIRTQLKIWREKTPAERAEYGLPETGWENVLFGHLGLDLSKL